MATKPSKKSPVKAGQPKAASPKKAKPPAKKAAANVKSKPSQSQKSTLKPASSPGKAEAAAKKASSSVKKAPSKKATSPTAPHSKTTAAKSSTSASKTNGSTSQPAAKGKTPAAPAPAPAPTPAPKPEAKKSGKAPFMPPASPTKPVPIPKAKTSLIDNAPDIAIKPVYNPKKMPPFYKKQHTRLLELRSALYDTMDGMAKEALRSRPEGSDASVGGMHMGDAGSDAYDRDFALSMLSKEQDALYEINEALVRLDRGVYGVCELSGKKIPDERLEALPYTRYTREMQEQIERDNMGGKFRRPVVRSVFGLDDASEEDDDEDGDSPKESSPQESSLDFMKE